MVKEGVQVKFQFCELFEVGLAFGTGVQVIAESGFCVRGENAVEEALGFSRVVRGG